MNWRYWAAKLGSWALVSGSAVAFYESQLHPQAVWLGALSLLLGGIVKDMQPSPSQAKVIEAQQKELDSLRPPPEK